MVEPTGADTQLYCRFNGQEVTAMVRDRVELSAPAIASGCCPIAPRAHLFDAAERRAYRRVTLSTANRHATEEASMSDFKRRDFLKATAGVAAGAALGAGPRCGRRDAAAQTVQGDAGEGRQAARAALEALRAGRRGHVGREHQEVHRR